MNSCDTCWHSFSFSSKSSYQRKWTPRLSVWEATLQDGLLCLLLFVLKQTKENHPGDFLSWPPRCTDVETLLETVGVMIKMLPTRSVNYKDLLENTVSLISFKDTANQHIFKESVCWILTFQQTLDFHVRRWSTRGCRARSQWSNPAFTVWHPWIFWRRPRDNFQMCLWRQKPDSVDGKSGQLQPCL